MDNSIVKAVMGVHAVHLPINLIFQHVDGDKFAGVFQLSHPDVNRLLQDSRKTHTLVRGDMIIRPHVVMGSDHMQGHGANGLYTSGWNVEEWIDNGDMLYRLPGGYQ